MKPNNGTFPWPAFGYVGVRKWAQDPAPPKVEAQRFEELKERLRGVDEQIEQVWHRLPAEPHELVQLKVTDVPDWRVRIIASSDTSPTALPAAAPPPPTKEELWQNHLLEEMQVHASMLAHDRREMMMESLVPWLREEPFEQGTWQPSTSGFGGGFVNVWRVR